MTSPITACVSTYRASGWAGEFVRLPMEPQYKSVLRAARLKVDERESEFLLQRTSIASSRLRASRADNAAHICTNSWRNACSTGV